MPQGHVTSARGESLNMDELKMKAKLPLALAKQKAQGNTEVKKKVVPRKPLNVRGHMPAQGEHKMADMPEEVKETIQYIEDSAGEGTGRTVAHDTIPPVAATAEGGTAENLADVTGVKVKASPEAIERQKARMGIEDEAPAEAASNEALSEIMDDLKGGTETAAEAETEEEKPARTRRTRAKKD